MNKEEVLLLDWMRKIHQLEYAQCYQSLFYTTQEKWIGILSFILTTTVAFTYRFPFINYPWVKEYVLPLIAFIVAILTGYQAFIKPGEKSEIHRKLGLEYEKLRHEIELLYLLASNQVHPELETKTKEFKSKWDLINTLYVKECYYRKAKEKVKSFNKYPKEIDFIPDKKNNCQ
ncbi:MAG: SLATT domain-containing protein [Chryseobacterium sp.]|nr:SLATT domain-containing protein [Chryseobacterium sp.]